MMVGHSCNKKKGITMGNIHPSRHIIRLKTSSGLRSKTMVLPAGAGNHFEISSYAFNAIWRAWTGNRAGFSKYAGDFAQCLRELIQLDSLQTIQGLTPAMAAIAIGWLDKYERAVDAFAVQERQVVKEAVKQKPTEDKVSSSRRDEFAKAALTGLIMRYENPLTDLSQLVSRSFEIADAMCAVTTGESK
jgi:hypothetical protein